MSFQLEDGGFLNSGSKPLRRKFGRGVEVPSVLAGQIERVGLALSV